MLWRRIKILWFFFFFQTDVTFALSPWRWQKSPNARVFPALPSSLLSVNISLCHYKVIVRSVSKVQVKPVDLSVYSSLLAWSFHMYRSSCTYFALSFQDIAHLIVSLWLFSFHHISDICSIPISSFGLKKDSFTIFVSEVSSVCTVTRFRPLWFLSWQTFQISIFFFFFFLFLNSKPYIQSASSWLSLDPQEIMGACQTTVPYKSCSLEVFLQEILPPQRGPPLPVSLVHIWAMTTGFLPISFFL